MTVLYYLKIFFQSVCRFCLGSNVTADFKWGKSRIPVVEINCVAAQRKDSCSSNIDIRISRRCSCSFMIGISPDSTWNQSHMDYHTAQGLHMYSSTSNYPRLLQRVPSVSDTEVTMPEMSQFSSVLSHYQVSALFLSFTPRLRLYPWTLLYSVTRDGCSLNNLYSKLEDYDYTLLLLILDTRKTAFGALLSPPNLKLKGRVYTGNPETFLFTFSPKLRKFHASGENNCFIQSMIDGISIGGWRPAIWIDSNLEKGMTDVSQTFDNSPLTDEHFVIRELECWALTELEYVEHLSAVPKSSSIYKLFPSSKLAKLRPPVEVGGVRCGRKSRGYHPTFRREDSHEKCAYFLDQKVPSNAICSCEQEDEEGDSANYDNYERRRVSTLPQWQNCTHTLNGRDTLSLTASASISSFYF